MVHLGQSAYWLAADELEEYICYELIVRMGTQGLSGGHRYICVLISMVW